MSLKLRVMAIVIVSAMGYLGLDYVIEHQVIHPSFVELERDQAVRDMDRCVEAIDREVHHLSVKLCLDWSAWDDVYQFAQDRNEAFAKANLNDAMFRRQELNLVYFADPAGKRIWSAGFNERTGDPLSFAEFPESGLPADHPILNYADSAKPLTQQAVEGVLATGRGPLLVAARPILTSAGEGPPAGTLIMGRLLDAPLVATLSDQTRVDFKAWPAGDETAPRDMRDEAARLKAGAPHIVHQEDGMPLQLFAVLNDLHDAPAVWMKAAVPCEISTRGATAMSYDRSLTLGVGVVVIVFILGLLERHIVNPIARLTAHTGDIARNGDLTVRLEMKRRDEIGQLADQVDLMVRQLREAHEETVSQSYYSGIDALMTQALRDINSALEPVNEEITALRDELEQAAASLARAPDASRGGDSTDAAALTRAAAERLDELLGRTLTLGQLLSNPRYFQRVQTAPKVDTMKIDMQRADA